MIATTVTAAAIVQGFLYFVGVFFVLYLIGYSTFLFLSVTVGSCASPTASASRTAA